MNNEIPGMFTLLAGLMLGARFGALADEEGHLQSGDALYVNRVAGIGAKPENLVTYVYREAVSPHLAAKLNHRPIDFDRVKADFARARERHQYLTMEGSGGIICPLRWDEQQHVVLDDLVKDLGLGVLCRGTSCRMTTPP